MPNWCFNTLSVDGAASAITKFREWLNDEPLTLQKIRPMPQELEETISPTPDWSAADAEKAKILQEKYGADNWYDWHVKNWGTKWDIEATEDDASDTNIYYSFDSAWSPSLEATKYLATLFPDLTFTHKYYETGIGFAGTLTATNGEYDQVYFDADDDKDAYRKYMTEEFDYDPYEGEEDEENDEDNE
jgi:hypothetical protein